MKKYAIIITCLAMLNGALLAQTSSGTSSDTGKDSSSSTSSGASSTDSSTSSGTSGQASGAISEPSGATTSSTNSVSGTTTGTEVTEPSGASGISQTPGVITIQGTVHSNTEKQEIERQLRQVSGVTDVRNKLQVSGSSTAPSEPQGSNPQSNP